MKIGKHGERLKRFLDAGLYLVTSQEVSQGRDTLDIVRCALSGGVRLVQLREKTMKPAELLSLARTVRRATADAGALLIINDSVDVALSVAADGVHLGQEDAPIHATRELGPDLIIGASCHSVDEARQAQADGASYVNIGPVFPTGTKEWHGEFLGVDAVKEISEHITIPFTVMGGIKKEHIAELVACGARTIAVVSAITAADDPAAASRSLLAEIGTCIRDGS